MKKDSFSKKTLAIFSRNYLEMNRLFWDHEKPSEFIEAVMSARKDLGIHEDLPFRDIYKEASGSVKKFNLLEENFQGDLAEFLASNQNKKTVLREKVGAILSENKLGTEWEEMVTLTMITGACLPPKYNVSVSRDEQKGTLTFTLNANTTKNDLDVAWKYTEGIRKTLFSNGPRASYPTKKTFRNHNQYVETIIQKVEAPVVEESDEVLGIIKSRPTRDKDIIPILYPKNQNIEKDEKALIKLRVNRFRQKK